MNDLFLEWGGDLAVSPSGDIAIVAGADTINQRLYRRLLTNPGDYIWNVDYGGGLSQFVGQPTNTATIEAVVRTQVALETAIPTVPEPTVSTTLLDASSGSVSTVIAYADPNSGSGAQIAIVAG